MDLTPEPRQWDSLLQPLLAADKAGDNALKAGQLAGAELCPAQRVDRTDSCRAGAGDVAAARKSGGGGALPAGVAPDRGNNGGARPANLYRAESPEKASAGSPASLPLSGAVSMILSAA